MTVQTFIPNGDKAASENTVTQPAHTQDVSIKKLYIETQGCQMNEYDSHRMADLLGDSHGYVLTTNPNEADILLMNTCSIREKAQEKVFSDLGRIKHLKARGVKTLIVSGFIEPLVKELPMEYAVEMNKLIQLQMEGSVG